MYPIKKYYDFPQHSSAGGNLNSKTHHNFHEVAADAAATKKEATQFVVASVPCSKSHNLPSSLLSFIYEEYGNDDDMQDLMSELDSEQQQQQL